MERMMNPEAFDYMGRYIFERYINNKTVDIDIFADDFDINKFKEFIGKNHREKEKILFRKFVNIKILESIIEFKSKQCHIKYHNSIMGYYPDLEIVDEVFDELRAKGFIVNDNRDSYMVFISLPE